MRQEPGHSGTSPNIADFLSAWGTALLIALLGVATLAAQHIGSGRAGLSNLVFVPPWRDGGLAFAETVGVPVLDVRWGGRLVVFAPTEDADALARMGPFVLATGQVAGCLWTGNVTGVRT